MTRAFKPRLDILSPSQRRIWGELHEASVLGFVLYGGTAIALRLGHRTSADFDFFTDRPIDRRALEEALPFWPRSMVLQDAVDTLALLVPAGKTRVKVSFFAGLRIGRVGKPEWTEDGVLHVASLDDLMATKLKVLPQRVESKDYLDLAAMLESGADLATGLAAARKLYGGTFQPHECLKALVYFEGGDLLSLRRAIRSTLIKAASSVRELPNVRLLARTLSLPTSEGGERTLETSIAAPYHCCASSPDGLKRPRLPSSCWMKVSSLPSVGVVRSTYAIVLPSSWP